MSEQLQLRSTGSETPLSPTDGVIESSPSPVDTAGLSSLTAGARIIYEEVGSVGRDAQSIADAAGFYRKGVERHLAALRDAGLVCKGENGWRRR